MKITRWNSTDPLGDLLERGKCSEAHSVRLIEEIADPNRFGIPMHFLPAMIHEQSIAENRAKCFRRAAFRFWLKYGSAEA